MVSKTRKQRQRRATALQASGGSASIHSAAAAPRERKSVHLKKTRPRMKSKHKVRLGLDSPVDVYAHFDEKAGVHWRCPVCGRGCRVVGFCVQCATQTAMPTARGSEAKGKRKVSDSDVVAARRALVKAVVAAAPAAATGARRRRLKLRKTSVMHWLTRVTLLCFPPLLCYDYYRVRLYRAFDVSEARAYVIDWSPISRRCCVLLDEPNVTSAVWSLWSPANGAVVLAREVAETPYYMQLLNGYYVERRTCGVELMRPIEASATSTAAAPAHPLRT